MNDIDIRCPKCGQMHGALQGNWFIQINSKKQQTKYPLISPVYIHCLSYQVNHDCPCGTEIVITSTGVRETT